ncbi:bifunctional 2-polyprenyl-6-hydroxyphenol methylase/3-demethylubiquinol 3-O-methyltransferase UbiG [Polynucleobacter sp. MG-6-Vaara-E2]|uniref:class I SAM-dependent methyltransferase n=1 Tax=Polynucleobacter sp. MG-6-Vaara-E2 TaxID=2576932 RepID=UPI001BFD2E78|nr:methyltransferase domain-containing protein [Polynucleobacter sp. MG-6-Vaara-E2]QWD96921.1 methyltransferase domain-containing protein [Polynucleobacter sp. MG-6-Vaara-E2]
MYFKLSKLIKRIIEPVRFKYIKRYINKENSSYRILDIGCGSQSPALTKYWINTSEYHGVDNGYWEDDVEGYKDIDKFYMLDLNDGLLDKIPEDHFDIIILSHVIEHIKNGEFIISSLCSKLRRNGLIYIETPSARTINYPSAIGFLNFYDDPTHIRCYHDSEILPALQNNNMKVMRIGCRCDLFRVIIFSPIAIIINLVYWLPFKRKICSHGLWDILCVSKIWIGVKK